VLNDEEIAMPIEVTRESMKPAKENIKEIHGSSLA
jgi:hypothetical protein